MFNGTEKIIMAGFGGQGILFMGRLLAYTGMKENLAVTFIPSYGAEMRGGTANCRVVLSETPIGSPLVEVPDSLIIMNKPSLSKFEPVVKEGGFILLNSSLIDRDVERDDVDVLKIPASEMAEEIGAKNIANLVALGAFLQKKGYFDLDTLCNALEERLPKSKSHLMEANRKALELGFNYVK